jgi:hypothetical protein
LQQPPVGDIVADARFKPMRDASKIVSGITLEVTVASIQQPPVCPGGLPSASSGAECLNRVTQMLPG